MFAHVHIAIGIQIICILIGRLFGDRSVVGAWIGCFAASAVCVMREVTQREYQWIELYGHGRRANMPDLAGLRVWEWNRHSIEETVVAIIASTLLALAISWASGRRSR
jgi:hypothetical protein